MYAPGILDSRMHFSAATPAFCLPSSALYLLQDGDRHHQGDQD
ncbi:MAG TPA: hypothetical protein V6D14_06120 [Coleofasciculaceae cyanobacterium]